jgi:hypothetical protein
MTAYTWFCFAGYAAFTESKKARSFSASSLLSIRPVAARFLDLQGGIA